MTLARMVVEGRTHLLTRKCAGDCLFLTPTEDEEAQQIYLYCLGLAALETGMEIHAFCAMGNHHHQCFTDVLGQHPWFTQRFHSILARTMNVMRGRDGAFFEGAKKSNLVHCVGAEDILDKMVYVAMNPVAAGLVSSPEEWPGAISLPHMFAEGYEIVVKKPRRLFRQLRRDGSASGEVLDAQNARHRARMHKKEKEPKPDVVRFKLSLPPGYKDLSRAEFQALFTERLAIRTQEIAAERTAAMRPRPLGVDKIFRQDWREPPPSKKKQRAEKERSAAAPPAPATQPKRPNKKGRDEDFLDPRIACAYDDDARCHHRKALLAFWAEYRAAFEAFRRRKRGVLFPYGTWGPKRLYNARVRRSAA